MLPCAAALFARAVPQRHLLGACYLVALEAVFLARYMLMLHYAAHRRALRGWAAALVRLALAPLFGLPPGLYQAHHVAMHHAAGNAWAGDASSTERYQRDSLLHFACYLARFAAVYAELPLVLIRAGRWALATQCALGSAAYLAAVRALWAYNAFATLWVLVVPAAVTLVALALGNWSQHVFLDPRAPRSAYGCTYNCLDCPDNQLGFNDGYHIVHHADSRCHWSEMPQRFVDRLDEHAGKDALCFRGVFFFDVGIAVFAGRLRFLATRIVDLDGAPQRDLDQKEAMLRERLRPVKGMRHRPTL